MKPFASQNASCARIPGTSTLIASKVTHAFLGDNSVQAAEHITNVWPTTKVGNILARVRVSLQFSNNHKDIFVKTFQLLAGQVAAGWHT